MTPRQSQHTHPCGALPVTTLNLAVMFCPTHNTHWASSYAAFQDSADVVDVSLGKRADFGPWDNYGTIAEWVAQRLAEWLVADVAFKAEQAD